MMSLGVAFMFGPLQCLVNSNSSRWATTAVITDFAASLPPDKVDAARMQRTITPEYMCHGCDCKRILIVIRSSPADCSNSSSFPNALAQYGQVGSRNSSNRRGPCPQVKGSAFHVAVSLICSIRSCNSARPRLLGFPLLLASPRRNACAFFEALQRALAFDDVNNGTMLVLLIVIAPSPAMV